MLKFDFEKTLKGQIQDFRIQVERSVHLKDWLWIQGESGSGKTTLLKIIAGLEKPDSGQIQFNDEIWFATKNLKEEDKKTGERNLDFTPTEKRNLAFVFQEDSLFPHFNLIENLKFGSTPGNLKFIPLLLEDFELEGIQNLSIDQLSGGQKKRTEIARAILSEPQILILDEPFSSLDIKMKKKCEKVLIQWLQKKDRIILSTSHQNFEGFNAILNLD